MRKEALLIVDVQNDFLPGGALPVPHGDRVIEPINRLQREFKTVLATQDWHPEGHSSFRLWPPHCIQGTWGAQFSPALKTEKMERVFQKGVDPALDSYSGFFDEAGERSTGLEAYLQKRGIQHLVVVGLATEYCVKYTVLDALSRGFSCEVVLEGCAGIDLHPGDVDRALEEMQRAGATFRKMAPTKR